MIIALFGAPGAGKDTVAEMLVNGFGYRRVAFADKVRELAYRTRPEIRHIVDTYGWENAKREFLEVRCVLETVGDGAREVLGEDVWVNAAFKDLDLDNHDYVITDLRKENEYTYLNYLDTVFVCVRRSGCEKRPFDQWRAHWAEYVIDNDGGLDELRAKVDTLAFSLEV